METMTRVAAAEQTEQVLSGRLVWVSLGAALSAALVNSGLYLVGAALGAFPETLLVPPGNVRLSLAQVQPASVIGVLGGAALLLLLGRLVRRPGQLFVRLAGAALLLSLLLPFGVPGGGPLFYAVLLLMHLVAGGLAIWLLPAYAVRR